MSEFAQTAVAKPLARQIKRYLKAPLHRWAAIVPPEAAGLCRAELRDLGIENATVSEAGVEFTARLEAGYLANLWLRTAGRVVCRVDQFRAGSAEQLFNKISAFPWELWLNANIPVRIEAHLRESRIEHQGLVETTTAAAMRKRCPALRSAACVADGRMDEGVPGELEVNQRVLVHLRRNRCEISLDSSGAHLHRRGYRRQHAGAPLRENLAAAILLKAGWCGDRPVLDGMCGAGTLAIEAAMLARRLPPGALRPFLFEQWPSFMAKTWQFQRREAAARALARCPAPIIAIERRPEALAAAAQNARRAAVDDDIQWWEGDFFSFRPESQAPKPGLLFLNPPYGKRLAEIDNLYATLGDHLRRFFRGWQVAIMAPDRSRALRMQLAPARIWHIRHGGMPVVVVLAKL